MKLYKDVLPSGGSSDVESLNLYLRRKGSKLALFIIIHNSSANLCLTVNHTQAWSRTLSSQIIFPLSLSCLLAPVSFLPASIFFLNLWSAAMEIRKKNNLCTVDLGHYSVYGLCTCVCTCIDILTVIERWEYPAHSVFKEGVLGLRLALQSVIVFF